MHLGSILARLENEADAAAAFAALDDLPLFCEVVAMSESFGESPGQYVAASAARFANAASDEEWLQLIAAIEKSAEPGRTVLTRIVGWALRDDRRQAPAVQAGTACGCTP